MIFDGQLDDEHFATDQNGMISHSYLYLYHGYEAY